MKPRVFLGLAIILAIVAVFAHIATSNRATKLTTALVAADTAGSDVAAPLATLSSYIKAHGGTHATFTLNGAYNRALAAAQAAASAQAANSQIYAAAQAACAGHADSITQAKCNADYLSQHLVSTPATTPPTAPELSSYQYHLTSPPFTFDLAGWSELAATASLVALVATRPRRHHV